MNRIPIFPIVVGLVVAACGSSKAPDGTYYLYEPGFQCTSMIGESISTYKDKLSLSGEVVCKQAGCDDQIRCGSISLSELEVVEDGRSIVYAGSTYVRQ
jgi:hypothetical protein